MRVRRPRRHYVSIAVLANQAHGAVVCSALLSYRQLRAIAAQVHAERGVAAAKRDCASSVQEIGWTVNPTAALTWPDDRSKCPSCFVNSTSSSSSSSSSSSLSSALSALYSTFPLLRSAVGVAGCLGAWPSVVRRPAASLLDLRRPRNNCSGLSIGRPRSLRELVVPPPRGVHCGPGVAAVAFLVAAF